MIASRRPHQGRRRSTPRKRRLRRSRRDEVAALRCDLSAKTPESFRMQRWFRPPYRKARATANGTPDDDRKTKSANDAGYEKRPAAEAVRAHRAPERRNAVACVVKRKGSLRTLWREAPRASATTLPSADYTAVRRAMAGLAAGFGIGPGDPRLRGRARAGRCPRVPGAPLGGALKAAWRF